MTVFISTKSQLMKNHVAGEALPAQRQIRLALDDQAEPIVLSLDAEGLFLCTLRSEEELSGWEDPIDLGTQLPPTEGGRAWVVEKFVASQGASGAIWIALAARAQGDATSTVFITRALANNAKAENWKKFGEHLIARPMPWPLLVERLSLGVGVETNPTPLLVVEGKDAAGEIRHVQVNPDPMDLSWTSEHVPMPQDATKCLAAHPG